MKYKSAYDEDIVEEYKAEHFDSEVELRNIVGDLKDALIAFRSMDRYNDVYIIFRQVKSGAIEHVGTLTHTRHVAARRCIIESNFVMRGPYGTFGCSDYSDWRTYQRGGDATIDRRAYLAFKMFDRCSEYLEQIGIDTNKFKKKFNTEWITAFEKAGYVVFHYTMDPAENPFGIQSEVEKSW